MAREITDTRVVAVLQRCRANSDAVDLTVPRNNIGSLFRKVDGKWSWFSYSLEDEVRAEFVKVFGATCIEAGLYRMAVTYSPKFKREMVEIVPLFETTTKFTGLRMHGGNTEIDSHGCPLIAYQLNAEKTAISKSAEKAWTAWVKSIGGGLLLVENKQLTADGEFFNYLL